MTTKARAVRYDEIEGKIVSGAGFGWSNMLIAFTDGTVLALRAEGDCDGPEIEFEQGRDIDLLSREWSSEASEAGLITRQQSLDCDAKREAEEIKRLEQKVKLLKANRKQKQRRPVAGEQ